MNDMRGITSESLNPYSKALPSIVIFQANWKLLLEKEKTIIVKVLFECSI
jgi:hypothetical protein